MILAYLRLANLQSSSDLAPVMTIFPLLKIRPVVFGLRSRMITAANRFGLYSVALPFQVIYLRSSLHPKSTVPTTFWILGRHSSGMELSSLWLRVVIIVMLVFLLYNIQRIIFLFCEFLCMQLPISMIKKIHIFTK